MQDAATGQTPTGAGEVNGGPPASGDGAQDTAGAGAAGAPAGPPQVEAATTGAAGAAGDAKIEDLRAAAEAAAAAELARIYRAMPGVVAELVGGQTIADVQAAFAAAQRVYADVRAAVLRDLGATLPGGHAAPGAPPAPADPFGLIQAGLGKQ